MSDRTMRVILLARPGEACTRLQAAVREAGAEVAVVCDPVDGDPADLADIDAQAVLVALDPTVEDALDRFEALLADPARTIVFEEAELAARREGWDAARWARHLAAKLNRHDDVLPPGGEVETDWQPVPGPLAATHVEIGELDIRMFTGEALQPAPGDPDDQGPTSMAGFPAIDFDFDSIPAGPASTGPDAEVEGAGLAAGLLSAEDMDWSAAAPGYGATSTDGLEDNEFAAFLRNAQALADDSGQAHDVAEPVSWLESDESDDEPMLTFDTGALGGRQDDDGSDGLPDLAFETREVASGDLDRAGVRADTDATMAATGSFGDALSLVDEDAPIAGLPASGGQRVERDLDALEQRAAGLSLADSDSYGHGPLRGAVVVEGGLGGPDAVRQLLGALPAEFPRAVLVRLQLDGGRYDRLVSQMARASVLPVALAVAGEPATAGTVYFLSPAIRVEQVRGTLTFAEPGDDADASYAALPAADSAVLFLSGSAPGLVDAAQAMGSHGALLAAQDPESCYDGVAAEALIAAGGRSAMPVDLAARLTERWVS